MLPDKKSTSFTWLQGVRRDQGTATEKMVLNDENAMEIESPKAPPLLPKDEASPSPVAKENKPRRGKKMTRMGASSLLRRAPNSGLMYQYMEQDLPEEDEPGSGNAGGDNISDTSKGSTSSSFSIGRKLNKTIRDVRVSIGNLSQRLRKSTRRRYALGDSVSAVDLSPTHKILGRTPTKLYSPFGFDSPAGKTPGRRHHPPMTPRMSRKASLPGPVRLYNSPMDITKTPNRVGLRSVKNSPVSRQSFRF